MKKKITKILAVILSILTLFSSFPAFALTEGDKSSVDKTHLDAYYTTGRWETADGNVHDNYGQVSLYNLKSTGEPIYCMQIYEDFAEGTDVKAKNIEDTDLWRNEYSATAKRIVTRVSIWGYPNYDYDYSKTEAQLATAVLIWEAETGARTNYDTGCTSWASSIFNNYPNALSCYNEILKACQDHAVAPAFNTTNVTLKSAGESNAVTLTDSNGLLSKFDIESSNSNIKTSVSGNNLKIWCTDADNYSGTLTLTKTNTDLNTAFALTDANQTMFYGTLSDPVQTTVRVNVEAEKKFNVSVEKQSSLTGETLTGAGFKVQQWSSSANAYVDYKTLTETGSGSATRYIASDLLVTDNNGGKFKLVETKVPSGYTSGAKFSSSNSTISSDGVFQFGSDDTDGKTFNFIVKNDTTTGNVLLKKTSEDGEVDGFKFHLYGTADIGVKVDEYGTSNKDGEIDFKNICVGTYTIEEVELPDCYIQPEKQTVTVKEDQTTQVSFENKLKRGGISGSKVLLESGDNKLGDIDLTGIKFAVVSNNPNTVRVNGVDYSRGKVVAIFETEANGDFKSANDLLPYGNYTLYELRRDSTMKVGSTYTSATKTYLKSLSL